MNLCESCGAECKSSVPFRTGRNHCRKCNKLICNDCLSSYRLHNKEKICLKCEDIVFGNNDNNKHKLNDNQLQVYSQLIEMGFDAKLSVISSSKCRNIDAAIQFITKAQKEQKPNVDHITQNDIHSNQKQQEEKKIDHTDQHKRDETPIDPIHARNSNICDDKTCDLWDSVTIPIGQLDPTIFKNDMEHIKNFHHTFYKRLQIAMENDKKIKSNPTIKKGKHRRINSAFQFVKGLSKQSKQSKASNNKHKRANTVFDRIKLKDAYRRHSAIDKAITIVEEKKQSGVEIIDVMNCDKSVSECSSITRMITYLETYQNTNLTDVAHVFNKNNYPFLTDDFNHILVAHLGDSIATSERQKQFECICDCICKKLSNCSLEKCINFKRNNRNRETQNISDKIESRSKYYVEIMDTIHCFFIHSFDVGYSIHSIDIVKMNILNRKDIDHQFYVDNVMKNISTFLEGKRERVRNIGGLERIQKTKFVTVFDEDEKKDNKLIISDENTKVNIEEKKQNNPFGALANESFDMYFTKEKDPEEFMKIFDTLKMDIWKLQNSSIEMNTLIVDYIYDYNFKEEEQKRSKNVGLMNEEIKQKINEIIASNTALCTKITTEIADTQKSNLFYSAKHPASTICQWRINVTNSFILQFKNASLQFSQQLEKHTEKIRKKNKTQMKQKVQASEYDEKESKIKHDFFMVAAETDGLLECLAEIKAQQTSARFNNMDHTLKEIQKLWTQFNVLEASQIDSLDNIIITVGLTEDFNESLQPKYTSYKTTQNTSQTSSSPKKNERRSRSRISFGNFGAKALEKLKKLSKQAEESTDDALQNQSYSFGHSYNYWNQMHPNYVHPKYPNLKFELAKNTIHSIEKEQFDAIYDKAQEKYMSNKAKTILAKKNHQYKIKEGERITLQHIMSICFYTDLDILQFKFSETFRSLNKEETIYDCKQRNREYRIFSKLLCEAINVFGTEVKDSGLSVFYHGVSKLLLFPSMITVFNSPTSTTKILSVARFFATDRGAILELEQDHKDLRYFDVRWLSAHVSEDERLFISPPDNFINPYQLRFRSIRATSNFETYERFVHAFTSLNYAVNGDYNSSHEENIKDRAIIEQLMTDYLHKNNTHTIPNYVENIFKVFVNNKREININIRNMDNYYQDLKTIFFVEKENDYGQLKRMEPQKIVQMELYHLMTNINNDIQIKKGMERKNGSTTESIKLMRKISADLEHIQSQMILLPNDKISSLLKEYLKYTQSQIEQIKNKTKANKITSNLLSTMQTTKDVRRRSQAMKLAAKQMNLLSIQTGDEQELSNEKYTSMLKICDIIDVFNKCEQITVRYATFTKMGTQYFTHILSELCLLNKKNKRLQSIKLYNGYSDKSKFDSFHVKFANNGWDLLKETGFHGPKDIAIKRQNKK